MSGLAWCNSQNGTWKIFPEIVGVRERVSAIGGEKKRKREKFTTV